MGARGEFDLTVVSEAEGGYSVFVPELPSVAAQGETIAEARANAREAIEGYLEVMREDGLDRRSDNPILSQAARSQ